MTSMIMKGMKFALFGIKKSLKLNLSPAEILAEEYHMMWSTAPVKQTVFVTSLK